MSYATEKLGTAIYKLATGELDIKGRLASITSELATIHEQDFPPDLQPQWQSILKRMTNKESKIAGTKYDEGSFAASLYRMRRSTAVRIAVDIIELEDRLQSAIADGHWH